MRRSRIFSPFGIACLLVVSGCGGSDTSTVSGTTAGASFAPTPSPSGPSASAAVIVDLGVAGITPFGSPVTIHSFGPSDRSPEPPAGSAWLEADVEWCLPPKVTTNVPVSQVRNELALELSDDTTIEPDAAADSPDEVFASDGTFSGNECVRGALVFAVPTGATPEYLLLVSKVDGMRWALA